MSFFFTLKLGAGMGRSQVAGCEVVVKTLGRAGEQVSASSPVPEYSVVEDEIMSGKGQRLIGCFVGWR